MRGMSVLRCVAKGKEGKSKRTKAASRTKLGFLKNEPEGLRLLWWIHYYEPQNKKTGRGKGNGGER